MTMQHEILKEIEKILDTKLSEMEDRTKLVERLVEDKMSEIEDRILCAVADLRSDSAEVQEEAVADLVRLAYEI